MIATDLDGTLLRTDGTVSRRTVDTLRRAEGAGITVVVATGRPLRWMRPVADMLGHTGLAVCANGALVYDMHTEQIVDSSPLQPSVIHKVADIVRAGIPDVTFAVETITNGFGQEPEYITHRDDTLRSATVAAIGDLVTDDVIKVLIQHQTIGPDDLLAAVLAIAGELAEFTHSSRHGLLEMSASNVTKASTLAHLVEQRGLHADDVIAFGDMPNDLPMLAWAGTGYAMANAHPDVLAAAEYVAPSNDDDGVAVVISDYALA